MFENISLAFQGIWSHKLRSFLTMLGVIIGIASIIAIVSTIKGTNEQIKQNLIGSGNNAVTVSLYQGDYPMYFDYASVPDGIPQVEQETVERLEALKEVVRVTVLNERSYAERVFYEDKAFNGAVRGIDSSYFAVTGYRVFWGRSFSEADYKSFSKVMILDRTAVTTLFENEDPLGRIVELSGEPFTVVGVAEQRSDFQPVINSFSDYNTYARTGSGAIYIPSACWPMVYGFDEPQQVILQAAGTDDMTGAGKKGADILAATLRTDSSLNITYRSEDLLEQAKRMQELSASTNQQLIWIASISLLVGGIGVMNIMLVSVTERTREIGLKKALGARRSRILRQFLTEAAVLTSIGGILGVAAGIVMARVVSGMSGAPVAIDVPAALIAVAFSMLIGILFGILPAVKAARLNPIEALARE